MPSDAETVRRLCRWFENHARDLPWRVAHDSHRREPYYTLVSEIMLQQTQVSRVVEKFEPFIQRFPTVSSLAEATEDDVFSMWSGLGYYRRARNLHRAAKEIHADWAGSVPRDRAGLLSLSGVGRYTAGAIASIGFDDPEPIVDGNVIRVVLRLAGRSLRSDEKQAIDFAWERAEQLVKTADRSRAQAVSPGTLNEAIMELGATVCTPKNPSCSTCPIRSACAAYQSGESDRIPLPKKPAARKPLFVACVLCRDEQRTLVQKRPDTGLWAGLYSTPTVERDDRAATQDEIRSELGCGELAKDQSFSFATTHRDITFDVWITDSCLAAGEWLTQEELANIGISNPQRRILLTAQPE